MANSITALTVQLDFGTKVYQVRQIEEIPASNSSSN